MYYYGDASKARLKTAHPKLQRLFNELIKHRDVAILCGHRNEQDQMEAVRLKRSKTPWPRSKHNKLPSLAVDAAPYPLPDWNNKEAWRVWGAYVVGFATGLGIKIRWGGDWNMNLSSEDEDFVDAPHFELLEE